MAVVPWINPINDERINIRYGTGTVEDITNILAEPKVLKYLNEFIWKTVKVSDAGIDILKHIMFGPNVGFVLLNMNCIFRKDNKPIPSIVLIRGDSVASLILIRNIETGELYHIKVRQFRVPCGNYIEEICAGMVDKELTRMSGAMVKEIKEETGVNITNTGSYTGNPHTQFNYLEELGFMIPSGGGCDEKIRLFWYQVSMTSVEISALNGKETGAAEENECIKVYTELFTWDNILKTHDAKAIAAAAFFAKKYPGVITVKPKFKFLVSFLFGVILLLLLFLFAILSLSNSTYPVVSILTKFVQEWSIKIFPEYLVLW